jgi:glycerol uptake facilitator-like aquaporin
MFVTRNISLSHAAAYVVAQSMGAILGSAVLAGVTRKVTWGNLGMTTIDKTLSTGQGFGVELIITFILVFTIFASCDKKRTDLNGSTPLTIGLCVSACHMLAIKYTGSSMNPARSFGPAVVLSNYPQLTNDSKSCLLATPTSVSAVFNHTTAIMRPDTVTECPHNYENIWTDQWVYWIAPITGGIMAGLLYEFLFAANASLARGRALVTCQPLEDVDSYDVNRDTVAMTPVKYTKTEEGEMVVV